MNRGKTEYNSKIFNMQNIHIRSENVVTKIRWEEIDITKPLILTSSNWNKEGTEEKVSSHSVLTRGVQQ